MNRAVIFLLAFACVLSYSGIVQADCCRTQLKLYYIIEDGYCADAGGHRREEGSGCEITICADGNILKTYFCGVTSCNIFGCNCDCRSGNWKQTFLANHPNKRIIVTDEYWS